MKIIGIKITMQAGYQERHPFNMRFNMRFPLIVFTKESTPILSLLCGKLLSNLDLS